MKIYNKHNFSLGLFFCLLGIAMLTVNIRKGFDIKGSLILALCLFFGIGILIRSLSAGLSREDKISELDVKKSPRKDQIPKYLHFYGRKASAFSACLHVCWGILSSEKYYRYL